MFCTVLSMKPAATRVYNISGFYVAPLLGTGALHTFTGHVYRFPYAFLFRARRIPPLVGVGAVERNARLPEKQAMVISAVMAKKAGGIWAERARTKMQTGGLLVVAAAFLSEVYTCVQEVHC